MRTITKKQLYKLYVTQNLSLRQIALIFNVSYSYIQKLRIYFKLPVLDKIHWLHDCSRKGLKRIKLAKAKRITTMKKNNLFIPWNKGLTAETDKRVAFNEKNRRNVRTYKPGPQGWHHTDEFKRKQSLAKGGTGIPYENSEYGADFDNALKEQVRFRDKYKCRLCGCSQLENGKQLDVHHIDYDKKYNKLNNLISLCHGCHTKTNINRHHWQNHFSTSINVSK